MANVNREKVRRFDFSAFSKLGKTLKDEEFKVAFFIYNTISLEGCGRIKIYRAVLADLCGKSERTISRITDRLNEKGVIIKDLVSDGSKLYNYYSLPSKSEQCVTENESKLGHEEPKTGQFLVTDDTFNNIYNIDNIYKRNNIYKEEQNANERNKPLDEVVPSSIEMKIPDEEILGRELALKKLKLIKESSMRM